MKSPLISVIVPVYNVNQYLKRCVDSIIKQSFEDYEVCLIDDGSTDGSELQCDLYATKYKERVRVFHQKNQGLGGARNTGIKAARGDYLFFVDSDDYISDDCLSLLVNEIIQRRPDLLIFNFKKIDETGRSKGVYSDKFIEYKPGMLSCQIKNIQELLLSFPSAWNKVFKRSLFTNYNICFPSKVWYEDIRTVLKVYQVAKRIFYLNQTLYYYVERKGSITNNLNAEKNKEIIDALVDIVDYYQNQGFYDQYYSELEYLAIRHLYISASLRVLDIVIDNEIINCFRNYLKENFPLYKNNKYLKTSALKIRYLFLCLEKGRYKWIRMIQRINRLVKK